MERAGAAVFDEILARYNPQPTQVVCGPGNNGGDGYVVARLLQEQGWPVQVICSDQKTPPYSRALWKGDCLPFVADSIQPGSLIIDGMFGIGLQRDLDDTYAAVVVRMNEVSASVVAIDIPSGVHTDTGHIMGFAVEADQTVTFDFRKPGHLLLPGSENCGELIVRHIGLIREDDDLDHEYVNHPDLWKHLFPYPSSFSHKYSRGYLNILGGPEMTGAARLAASSARRMGAGMTRIESLPVSHEIYKAECLGTLTRAISSAQEFAADDRVTAALIGPGSGRSQFTKQAVLAWLKTERPCVLDADALYVFKDNPNELLNQLYPGVVLTPHEGEFRNLFDLTGTKIERVRQAARISGATVLLKGADTVIADPSGLVLVQDESCPYLASGGTGDILAGMIGALLSQEMPGLAAAACGAYVHLQAGRRIGLGLIAEDIADAIPEILQELQ
jgi:ADP-dependent NAD(P)H-hydrate dehydratase / NAD(P)H-hydrate epimerase